MAGIVDISKNMQPQIHNTNAIVERIGDSHSKQLLFKNDHIKFLRIFHRFD